MLAFALAAALAALAPAVAQSNLTIQVGSVQTAQGGIFQFIPPFVNASVGDVVTFVFSGIPGNHSVTQSSFASPCQPLAGGFDTGTVEELVAGGAGPLPSWNLTVTNTSKPIWFFCKQLLPAPHCTAGMVGGINVDQATFASFQQAAAAASGLPGQSIGALVGQGASASAPPGPLPSDATAFGVPTAGSGAGAASGSASGAPPAPASSGASAPGSAPTSGAARAAASVLLVLAGVAAGVAVL